MRLVVIGICITSFLGCTQKEKVNLLVNRDKEGNILSEIPYIGDTIKHGLAKYYYINGDLSGEVEFKNGKRDGWQKDYYLGEILESKVHFVDGLQEGEANWYYRNGKIKGKGYWRQGTQYGSVYLFTLNGIMVNYNCKNHFENTFYDIRWDSVGNKLLEEGFVFSPEFYIKNIENNKVKLNREYSIEITVAEPPETKATIWMGEITTDKKIENFKELPIENNTATYRHTFTRMGKHTLITVGELKDRNEKIIKENRLETEITVVE